MVLHVSSVYVVDLKKGHSIINYCAASFPYFMQIMKLYQTVYETIPRPKSVSDGEGYRCLEEAERVLREQVAEIDPTALAKESNFWSA